MLPGCFFDGAWCGASAAVYWDDFFSKKASKAGGDLLGATGRKSLVHFAWMLGLSVFCQLMGFPLNHYKSQAFSRAGESDRGMENGMSPRNHPLLFPFGTPAFIPSFTGTSKFPFENDDQPKGKAAGFSNPRAIIVPRAGKNDKPVCISTGFFAWCLLLVV